LRFQLSHVVSVLVLTIKDAARISGQVLRKLCFAFRTK
jgi:hypothetical protein